MWNLLKLPQSVNRLENEWKTAFSQHSGFYFQIYEHSAVVSRPFWGTSAPFFSIYSFIVLFHISRFSLYSYKSFNNETLYGMAMWQACRWSVNVCIKLFLTVKLWLTAWRNSSPLWSSQILNINCRITI